MTTGQTVTEEIDKAITRAGGDTRRALISMMASHR